MYKNHLILLLACLIVMPRITHAELSYVGSSTIGTGILNAGAAQAFHAKSGKKFTSVQLPGSGKGIDALMEGETTLAGIGRPLKSNEKRLGLVGTVIGHDAIAVFVHASNPIRDLSREQLKGIFTGKIANWQKVGGSQAAIAPTTEIHLRQRATGEMFREAILDGVPYGDLRQVDLPRDQLLQLAKDPNGVCAVSIGFLSTLPPNVRKKVKAVSVSGIEPSERNVRTGAYPISRPLLLVTKGKPKGDTGAFIRFMLSPEGQRIVDRNFIPVGKKP